MSEPSSSFFSFELISTTVEGPARPPPLSSFSPPSPPSSPRCSAMPRTRTLHARGAEFLPQTSPSQPHPANECHTYPERSI